MPDSKASWCVQVDVAADEIDATSGRLWAGGATSVQEVDLGTGRVRLVAGAPAGSVGPLAAAVDDLAPVSYEADYDGWLDAWRPFARPVRVGRILVHPAWEEPDAAADDLVVAIDAQRAFGQGSHPTTRLVLSALAARVEPDTTVLDVGCGSGILSVVAARLGGRVVAVDLEPEAVDATCANAARNGVDDRIEVSDMSVADVEGAFDLVLANILASVLVELAPAVVARLAPGGTLVLSGHTEAQRDRVVAAYRPLSVAAETAHDDWRCLVLTPPP